MASRSKFTPAQRSQLRANPYVVSASENTVTFTAEFKQLYFDDRHSGLSPRDIFRRYGINPDILGDSRIRGFEQSIRSQSAREAGFQDRRRNREHGGRNGSAAVSQEQQISRLQTEVAYLHQCFRFLKKRPPAGWERRRRAGSGCLPRRCLRSSWPPSPPGSTSARWRSSAAWPTYPAAPSTAGWTRGRGRPRSRRGGSGKSISIGKNQKKCRLIWS